MSHSSRRKLETGIFEKLWALYREMGSIRKVGKYLGVTPLQVQNGLDGCVTPRTDNILTASLRTRKP